MLSAAARATDLQRDAEHPTPLGIWFAVVLEQLIEMGHKVLWPMTIWGKPYVYMRDHEGTAYLAKINEDNTLTVL